MEKRDIINLVILAALWGSSFLFMRVAAPEFGPIAMIQVRIVVGALFLLPLVFVRYRNELKLKDTHHYIFVGATNSALPFCLLGFSTLHLSAGYTSILNSVVPIWSAIIGMIWLKDILTRTQLIGLVTGMIGVAVLISGKGSLTLSGPTLAILAAILATISYGISANYTKKHMGHIKPILIATMSLFWGSIVLIPFTIGSMPEQPISIRSWIGVIFMGVFCTAVAYIIFYGLISRVGPTKTVTVTYLVPVFGMFWGAVFLDEAITAQMIIGCIIILLGTSQATGVEVRSLLFSKK